MKCFKCGNEEGPGAVFCGNCGSKLEAAPVKACAYCKTPFNDGEVFCGNCGKRLEAVPETVKSTMRETVVVTKEKQEADSVGRSFFSRPNDMDL